MPLSKSPALNLALQSIGITTPLQVLEHLPRRYESFEYTERKNVYEDKERIVVLGKLRGSLPRPLRFASRTLYRFYFETTSGEIFLVEAWNRAYLGTFLTADTLYTLSGVYEKKRHSLALVNIVKGEVDPTKALRPVYTLPNTIPNHVYAALVKRSLSALEGQVVDIIPDDLRKKYRLISRYAAFQKVHEPTSLEDIHQGLRVLKYEEALLFSLKNQIVRGENRALLKDRRRQVDREKLGAFIKTLPYKLTPDQAKALSEGLDDMDSPHVMYRLLQGDVGTGKPSWPPFWPMPTICGVSKPPYGADRCVGAAALRYPEKRFSKARIWISWAYWWAIKAPKTVMPCFKILRMAPWIIVIGHPFLVLQRRHLRLFGLSDHR
jgi:ATP-dependent DNA helicase RecG